MISFVGNKCRMVSLLAVVPLLCVGEWSLQAGPNVAVFEFQGHFYARTTTSRTWIEAEAEAVSRGAHLVAVNSQEENDFLLATFSDGGQDFYWIGLSDQETEGEFRWSNGEPLTYQNWSGGEPNNSGEGEDFVAFLPNGRWNDATGTNLRFGIIEFTAEPTTPERERQALISLYQATNGDEWTQTLGWKEEPLLEDGFNDDPCREPLWFGVTCLLGSSVHRINLTFNNLKGPIPAGLGDLSQLTILVLAANKLSGAIPAELGNLSRLRHLSLPQNPLTEPVPAELGRLSELLVLNLAHTDITGIPPELGDLSQLTELILTGIQFQGPIPPELGNLSRLTRLIWQGTPLSGRIPPELGNLSGLRELDLARNQLSGTIPAQLGNLSQLTDLQLDSNRLSGRIPPELGNLSQLTHLKLNTNRLSGPIPPELGNLFRLTDMILFSNRLSGPIPPELGNLSQLTDLDFNTNRLSGPIPPELGNLSRLTDLKLFTNQLSGPIPPELGNLSQLRALHLSNNQLSGMIPGELGNLSELLSLGLRSNRLSGISPGLGRLSQFTGLNLSHNVLRGTIPADFGDLTRLRLLSLEYNRLDGPIPSELGKLSQLERLNLRDNQMSGPIPPELGNLSRLSDLDMSNNQLTGPIPPELGNLSRLSDLDMSNNQLTGPIPPEVGKLSGLRDFSLKNNRLSGLIPPELGNLRSLSRLQLGSNRLSGTIPAEIAGVGNPRRVLDLSSNQLEGEVPVEIASRTFVDVRNNRLESVEGGISSPLDASQIGKARWKSLQKVAAIYPHLAIGTGMEAVLLVSNSSNRPWDGMVYLDGDNWPADRAWEVDGRDMTGESSFEVSLEPLATRRLVLSTPDQGPYTGWLSLRAEDVSQPEDVAASLFYNLSTNGELTDSTGIAPSELSTDFHFPVEHSETVFTGVAIRSVASMYVRLTLNSTQMTRPTSKVTQEGALLLNELFDELPPDFIGSVRASSSVPFSMTVIRVEITESGGLQMTSIPATPVR